MSTPSSRIHQERLPLLDYLSQISPSLSFFHKNPSPQLLSFSPSPYRRRNFNLSLRPKASISSNFRLWNEFNRFVTTHCERIPIGLAGIDFASLSSSGGEEGGGAPSVEEVGPPVSSVGNASSKKVLILMSDTGGGHRASAEAIRDAFNQEFGDECRQNAAYFHVVVGRDGHGGEEGEGGVGVAGLAIAGDHDVVGDDVRGGGRGGEEEVEDAAGGGGVAEAAEAADEARAGEDVEGGGG